MCPEVGDSALWRHKSVISHREPKSCLDRFFLQITLQKSDLGYLSPFSRKSHFSSIKPLKASDAENDEKSSKSAPQKAKKARKEKKTKEKGKRKNIRKIIGDDKLDAKTLQARQEEIERAKQAEER